MWGLVCLRLRVGDGIAWVSDAIALAGIDRRGGWFGLIFLLSGIARCGDFVAITGEKMTILYFWRGGGRGSIITGKRRELARRTFSFRRPGVPVISDAFLVGASFWFLVFHR